MPTSRSRTEAGAPPPAGEAVAADATEPGAEARALLLAVSEQGELLAMLTASVRAGLGPLDESSPSGAVDLIGALGPLEDPDVPGSDPLRAFSVVAPRFVRDAEQAAAELGAA